MVFHPYRALILKDVSAIVVSDLHIGIEESSLLSLRIQTQEMIKRINELVDEYKAKRVVLNGDIKHGFGKDVSQEWEEIRAFIESINADVLITKGNHDFYIQNIVRDKASVSQYVKLGRYLITHGHEKVNEKGDITIIGDEHPSITLRDDIGVYVKVPCFLYFEDLIVLPSFNPLSRGSDMLRNPPISAYLKNKPIDEAEVLVINEDEVLEFGRIKEIKRILMGGDV